MIHSIDNLNLRVINYFLLGTGFQILPNGALINEDGELLDQGSSVSEALDLIDQRCQSDAEELGESPYVLIRDVIWKNLENFVLEVI